MEIPRKDTDFLKNLLLNSSSPHNVLLVSGARQVGKTTLIKTILKDFKNTLSFNLEEDLVLKKEINQTESFEEFSNLFKSKDLDINQEQIIFIDEAQESTKLGSYIRFMKEKWLKTRCILSGYSMNRLFRNEQRIPVGRIQRFLLKPLQLDEFLLADSLRSFYEPLQEMICELKNFETIPELTHSKLLEGVDKYLNTGGLPEVVKHYLEEKNYLHTRKSILIEQEEDFVRKASLKNKYQFMEALRGVSANLGFPSKYTQYANSSYEGKKIVQTLEDWHLVYSIEQKGINSTTSFYPKRYCYDMGIAQDVRNMPFPKLSLLKTKDPILRTALGGIFENLVLTSLLSKNLSINNISSWKQNSQNETEVDFVIREGQDVIPIEVKASMKITPRHFKNLKLYLEMTGLKTGILISSAPLKVIKEKNYRLINIPIYLSALPMKYFTKNI